MAQLPEALLRHRVPEGNDQLSSSVDHGRRSLEAAILDPDSAGGVAPDSIGWGFPGVAQMRWPAWRRDQDAVSSGDGEDNLIAHCEASKGKGWNPYESSGVHPNTGPSSGTRLGRTVGPFGKGTGAIGNRRMPVSSGLFGDAEQRDGVSTVGSGTVPRYSGVFRGGAVATSVGNLGRSRLRGNQEPNTRGPDSKTGDWIPDLSVGVGPRQDTAVAAENTDGSSRGFTENPPVLVTGNATGTMGMGYPATNPTSTATAILGHSDGPPGRGQISAGDSKSMMGFGTVDEERTSENSGVKVTSWMAAAAKRQPAASSSFGTYSAAELGGVGGSTLSAAWPAAAEVSIANPDTFAVLRPSVVEEEGGGDEEDNPFA